MNKEREMLNINANLVDEVKISKFEREGEEIRVANFTLVKKHGDGKEYTNCSVYGDKVKIAETFKKGDFIHIFGYVNERKKHLLKRCRNG